jgi:hypothetical protein
MFVQGVRVLENGRSREDCLFSENWVIIANNYFGENFMCGAASAIPPTSNNDKFWSLSKKKGHTNTSPYDI